MPYKRDDRLDFVIFSTQVNIRPIRRKESCLEFFFFDVVFYGFIKMGFFPVIIIKFYPRVFLYKLPKENELLFLFYVGCVESHSNQ